MSVRKSPRLAERVVNFGQPAYLGAGATFASANLNILRVSHENRTSSYSLRGYFIRIFPLIYTFEEIFGSPGNEYLRERILDLGGLLWSSVPLREMGMEEQSGVERCRIVSRRITNKRAGRVFFFCTSQFQHCAYLSIASARLSCPRGNVSGSFIPLLDRN